MTDKFMTAAVFAALAFALGALGGTPEPFARGDAQTRGQRAPAPKVPPRSSG